MNANTFGRPSIGLSGGVGCGVAVGVGGFWTLLTTLFVLLPWLLELRLRRTTEIGVTVELDPLDPLEIFVTEENSEVNEGEADFFLIGCLLFFTGLVDMLQLCRGQDMCASKRARRPTYEG